MTPRVTRGRLYMKARYYAVARRLLEARADNPEEASSHPIIKEPFNAQHEAGAYTRPLLSSP